MNKNDARDFSRACAERDAARADVARLKTRVDELIWRELFSIAERDMALAEVARLRALAAETIAAFNAVEADRACGYETWMESSIAAGVRLNAAMLALAGDAA